MSERIVEEIVDETVPHAMKEVDGVAQVARTLRCAVAQFFV